MLLFSLGMLAQIIEPYSNLGEPLLDRGCDRRAALIAVPAPERPAAAPPLRLAHRKCFSKIIQ
jgi:hypothetical protein